MEINTQKGKEADELNIDSILLNINDKNTTIKSLTHHKEMKKVYNLTVGNVHTYYVGLGGILGHNAVCGEGWIRKSIYNKIPKDLRLVFEKVMAKGLVGAKNESGIKFIPKGIKIGKKTYYYELKTPPKSKYGNHRLYGNVEEWTNQKNIPKDKVMFETYKKSH